jgi:hypothetical protein
VRECSQARHRRLVLVRPDDILQSYK